LEDLTAPPGEPEGVAPRSARAAALGACPATSLFGLACAGRAGGSVRAWVSSCAAAMAASSRRLASARGSRLCRRTSGNAPARSCNWRR